ncbi:MAG: hypothetical protein EP330_26750 [Deltaproteobacteria bacterium]|nr:MAG: hypothetical protein EP330_26750 [Deltaproteobacteria bacterium]
MLTRILPVLALLACGSPPPPAEPAPEPVVEAPAPPPAPPAPKPYLPAEFVNTPPEGWVDLTAHIPGIRTEIRYHTANNFTEAPLPGYGAPGAWLLKEPADALVKVQADLADQGLGLLVYDAYRPRRGTLGMVAWAERTDQVFLLDNGYIARVSGHNRGNTIDLTLVDLATGEPLDMGTPWDTLSEASHTKNAEGTALDNRLKLKAAMEAHGWAYYWKEWWHFSFEMDPRPKPRDVPYGCFEPEEGSWSGPEGWNVPGYEMPRTVAFAACEGMDAERVDALNRGLSLTIPDAQIQEQVLAPDMEIVGIEAVPLQLDATGKPAAAGGLSLAQIDATVAANPDALAPCIDAENPTRIMAVKIAIAPEGKVTSVSAAPNAEGQCVVSALTGLAFPAAEGPTEATWFLQY